MQNRNCTSFCADSSVNFTLYYLQDFPLFPHVYKCPIRPDFCPVFCRICACFVHLCVHVSYRIHVWVLFSEKDLQLLEILFGSKHARTNKTGMPVQIKICQGRNG